MTSVHQLADRKLLDRYAPPGVLLNENLEILQFRGRTAPYLEPAPGLASLQILKHIHPELHAELRAALDQSRAEGVSISREPVTLRDRDSGVVRNVAIEVLPLVDSTNRSGCLLVLFKEDRPFTRAAADPRPEPSADMPGDNITRDIERELQSTKEYLQTTIEELETANEELKSSNEELQSSNEELQSTNEELETAKEELQSSNEELTTVNDELQTRMSELSLSMDDLSNVLSGVEAAVVIVGIDLRVRRFSHAAEKLLDLTGPNLGRAVELIAARVKNIDIVSAIQEVIARAAAAQYDVAIGRRWYAMRISPYLSADHSIRGALLTFDPTPENGHSLDQALAAAEYAGTLLVAIRHALLIMDETTRVVWANGAFYRAFDLSPDQTLGRPMAELPNHPWTDPEVVERVRATLSSGVPFKDFEIEAAGASSGPARGQATARKKMRLGGNIIPNPPSQNGQPLILIVVETVDEDEPPPRA
jgi:two-component system CheB/CheR fusion protein